MDFLVWGTIVIVGTAIALVTIVLGVYYLLTKPKHGSQKEESKLKIKDQREVK